MNDMSLHEWWRTMKIVILILKHEEKSRIKNEDIVCIGKVLSDCFSVNISRKKQQSNQILKVNFKDWYPRKRLRSFKEEGFTGFTIDILHQVLELCKHPKNFNWSCWRVWSKDREYQAAYWKQQQLADRIPSDQGEEEGCWDWN